MILRPRQADDGKQRPGDEPGSSARDNRRAGNEEDRSSDDAKRKEPFEQRCSENRTKRYENRGKRSVQKV